MNSTPNSGGLGSTTLCKTRIPATMISWQHLLTYICLLVYILLSSGWVLSTKYFNFPYPIALTMIHMGFSGAVAFFLIRVFKVVSPVKMTFKIYATCVIPISAFFASSLWFGNTAYLYIFVAFIQMLKALMPVATFLTTVVCGTDKLRFDVFLNMVLVSIGVVVSSYGEIHFNVLGTTYQVMGMFGVLKDWILIALSTALFPESMITSLNIMGYAIALCGVIVYNYLKVRDARASQFPPEGFPDRAVKEFKVERRESDVYIPR